MATTMQRQQRQATPARWQKAVERASAENVQVRQLAGSGAWIATSGSDPNTAYELGVTGEVAHGCNCLAGLNGDPVCRHRAAFYLAVGLLDPEPDPPAPAITPYRQCEMLPARLDERGRRLKLGRVGPGAIETDVSARIPRHPAVGAVPSHPGNLGTPEARSGGGRVCFGQGAGAMTSSVPWTWSPQCSRTW